MTNDEIQGLLGDWLQGNRPAIPGDEETIAHVLEQADWHGISPLLHHLVNHSGELNALPETMRTSLAAMHKQAIAGTLFADNELHHVYKLLADITVNYLLFKGTPLSHTLYPAPYLRVRCDTDILFPDEVTARDALRLFEQCEYVKPGTVDGKIISQELSCYKSSKTGFVHTLDLHWRVNNNIHFAGAFTFDELWENSRALQFDGSPRYPSPVYSFLLACIHRVAHIPFGESDRLIWLYDIHLLCNSFSEKEWSEINRLILDKKLSASVLDSLQKSAHFLGTGLPETVMAQLAAHANESPVQPQYEKSRLSYLQDNLRLLPGWRARLQLINEHLFPSADYMYSKYGIHNPVLLPFLYLTRIITGLPGLLGKHK